MDNLQAQLERVQAQIAQEKAKGAAERNDAKIAQLEQDEADILAQMDEAKKQAQDAAIEEKVQAEPVPFSIEGVELNDLPVELIDVIDLIVKADRRRMIKDHDEEIEKVTKENDQYKRDMDSMVEALRTTNKKLHGDLDAITQQLDEAQRDNARLSQQLTDAEQKRDAAATALDDANREIDRLKSEVDDYQKAKVFGEREAQNVIEVNKNEAEQINEAIKKYVSFVNYGTINKVIKEDGTSENITTDELLEKWTKITPPQLGGAESADSFRGEDTQADAENNQLSPTEEAENVDSFPIPVQNNLDTVDRDTAVQKVVGETVSREEFEELKERVSRLEQMNAEVAA